MPQETQLEVMNLASLANNSMYVSISFERFGNSRRAKVEMTTEAVESRFSHSKRLLNSPELTAIAKADTGIKASVDALCLPSKHEMAGLRMAPNKNVLKIAAILKEYKTTTRPALIADLVAAYPAQLQEASAELKEHFDPSDFPTISELADEFNFTYAFVNLGVPQAMADLSPELFEEQKAQQAETFKSAMDSVSETLLATFSELVNKLNDGLNGKSSVDGKKKSLLPSHFDKLSEFIANFEAMSSFAPAVLKAEVVKMQQLLIGVDIEKVRHSDNLKGDLIAKVGEAASTMVANGNLKGRFFRQPVPKPMIDIDAEMKKQPQDRDPGLDQALLNAAYAHGVSKGKIAQEIAAALKKVDAALPGENDMLAAMMKSAGAVAMTPTEETDKLADEL